ncbi:hypothetical protein BC831DRAFT_453088 [Entophlyctis helioformis]|nr:hypothetical protein BC831DRAFT_453088 [Entophlyctis helioformis]
MRFTRLLLTKHVKSSILWSHRLWVRSRLDSSTVAAEGALDTDNVQAQLDNTLAWCKAHVSDYTGWNFRHWLLTQLHLHHGTAAHSPLVAEINLCHTLIEAYDGHESLWYHLRSLSRLACLVWPSQWIRSSADTASAYSIAGDRIPSAASQDAFAQRIMAAKPASGLDREFALVYRHLIAKEAGDGIPEATKRAIADLVRQDMPGKQYLLQ